MPGSGLLKRPPVSPPVSSSDTARLVSVNTAILIGAHLVTWAATFVLTIFVARFLGIADFGRIFFAFSFCGIFSQLFENGINPLLIRDVARDRTGAPELVRVALGYAILAGAGLVVTVAVAVRLMGYDPVTTAVVSLICARNAVSLVYRVFEAYFKGIENFAYISAAEILEKVMTAALGILLVVNGFGVVALAWVYLASFVLATAYLLVVASRFVPIRPAFDAAAAFRLVRRGLPFFLWLMSLAIYCEVDVTILSLLAGAEAVGIYGAAWKLYLFTFFFVSHFQMAFFPAFSRLQGSEPSAMAHAVKKVLRFLVFATVPIYVGALVEAPRLVALFFGERFAGSGTVLLIVSNAILPVTICMVLGSALLVTGREKAWGLAALSAAAIGPLLNLLLIPIATERFGAPQIGVAVARVATECFMLYLAVRLVPMRVFDRTVNVTILKALAAGAVMAAVVLLCRALPVHATLPIGCVAYLIAERFLGVLPAWEKREVVQAIVSKIRRK